MHPMATSTGPFHQAMGMISLSLLTLDVVFVRPEHVVVNQGVGPEMVIKRAHRPVHDIPVQGPFEKRGGKQRRT